MQFLKYLIIQYLRAPHLDVKDVATAVEDFLLAGVHTTAYSSGFLLHHLACNLDVQLRLAKESRAILNSAAGPNLSRFINHLSQEATKTNLKPQG